MRNVGGSLTYLLLYMDVHIIVTGNNQCYIDTLIAQLRSRFEMTDAPLSLVFPSSVDHGQPCSAEDLVVIEI